jgi:hypothetical protein
MASDVIFKIVSLFLIFMAVLAMFGKLRIPGAGRLSSVRCPKCNRFRIGKGPCDCQAKGKRRR